MVERFEQKSPVSVMVRALVENVFAAERLDGIFTRLDHAQDENGLLFSTIADILGLVAMRIQPSVHAAFQARAEEIGVTAKAVYDKLQRVKGEVSRAVVRETAVELEQIVEAMRLDTPAPLPGYRVKILDGNHLRRTERRLKVLRDVNGAPLPGHAVVVLDPQRKLVIDVFPCEDAHAQERTLLPAVLETIQRRDVWIADRNFCTTDFLLGIDDRGGCFVIREHGQSLRSQRVGRRTRVGRCDTGTLYEQPLLLRAKDGSATEIRRVSLVLDEPTRDGETEIHILTNLPVKIAAAQIAELYRSRWSIEKAFLDVAKNLAGEVVTLGYPRAALFSFCMALASYNLLSVVLASLSAVHGHEVVDEQVSIYYLADEVAHTARGLTIAIPDSYWRQTYRDLSPPQLARALLDIAATVRLARYKKHKRRACKKTPTQNKRRRNHVSTARLLNSRQITNVVPKC
jgi:hypothetical protein